MSVSNRKSTMYELITLHTKPDIEVFARKQPHKHLFALGDLDDAFWPHTQWYGWCDDHDIHQLALIYTALATPVLIALADPPQQQMHDFLRTLLPLLPYRIYAHLDPHVLSVLTDVYRVTPRGIHWRMGLTNPAPIATVDTASVVQLTSADLESLTVLYATAYPGNVFHAYELQTGRYYGIRQGAAIISVAGVHVYSRTYKVAALGNVTTHPAMRRRGLSRQVCARLCQALLEDGISTIGLTVQAKNAAAIGCYGQLGFTKVMEFGVYMLESHLGNQSTTGTRSTSQEKPSLI